MKQLLLTILLISAFCTGCIQEERPNARRRTVATSSIVVVTKNNCPPCIRQKRTLELMKDDDLKYTSVREVNHETRPELKDDFPATSYPTLYISTKSGTQVAVGYQSRSEILSLLRP